MIYYTFTATKQIKIICIQKIPNTEQKNSLTTGFSSTNKIMKTQILSATLGLSSASTSRQ